MAGLFKRKKSTKSRTANGEMTNLVEQHVFTVGFREDLRNHGRLYFENIIKANGELLGQELQATTTQLKSDIQAHLAKHLDNVVGQLNEQIKDYVATQLNKQLTHHSQVMAESQQAVLESVKENTASLKAQYEELGVVLRQNIDTQNKSMNESLASNSAQLGAIHEAQAAALQSITDSAAALRQQHEQMSQVLQQNVVNQEKMMIDAFQSNMSQIIEHYLSGAISEQYDLKAQLPAIIDQMKTQQQEMTEDMSL